MKSLFRKVAIVFVLMLFIAPIPASANSNTLAFEGSAGPDSSTGDYQDTWAFDENAYDGLKTAAGEAYVILNFSIASDNFLKSFNYSMNGGSYGDDDGAGEFWIYDAEANDWSFIDSFGWGAGVWSNGSYSAEQFTEDSKITIKFNSTDSDGGAGVSVVTAWLHNIDSDYRIPPEDYTVAYIGIAGPDDISGHYSETWVADGEPYQGIEETAGESYAILNFTIPAGVLDSFNYSFRCASQSDDDGPAEMWVYDWVANDWVYFDDGYKGYYDWTNGILSSAENYSDGTQISIMVNSTDADGLSRAAIDSAFIYNIDFLSWELNNEADFIIYVSLPVETLFLLNSFPIFLGLVLIPASGLYLVHGGKEAMNTTKLYYVLVVFFIGWALLIGGIIS
jgi:hypothetical protein